MAVDEERTIEPDPDAWRLLAACRGADADVFFDVDGHNHDALVLCHDCPVRVDCLTFALESNEEYGVWGGLNANQRQRTQAASGQRSSRPKQHGTHDEYQRGCRCGACTVAMRAHRATLAATDNERDRQQLARLDSSLADARTHTHTHTQISGNDTDAAESRS